jgi:hypothetical protein
MRPEDCSATYQAYGNLHRHLLRIDAKQGVESHSKRYLKRAPQGRRRRAWGFNPRYAPVLSHSEAPKGRRQQGKDQSVKRLRPFGARLVVGTRFLGLKPQALRLRPCGAGFRRNSEEAPLLQPGDERRLSELAPDLFGKLDRTDS